MTDWGAARNHKFSGPAPTGRFHFGPPPPLEPQWKSLPLKDPSVPSALSSREGTLLAHEIRSAVEGREPEEAIQRIDDVWRIVDKLAALAESQMRLLLSRVKGPELAVEPPWLSKAGEAVLKMDANERAPTHAAVDSARRLARALLLIHPKELADLEPAPAGAVIVKWRGSSLHWLVSAPRLPWPGVSVRAYARRDPSSPKLEPETSHYAPTVLEHANKNL
jgi:hypothetical protein